MARQRQFQIRRRRSSNKAWAGVVGAAYVILPAATKVLAASFTLSNPGIDETVLRTVGLISVQSDQSSSAEEQIGALGVCEITDRALAVGITAIPDPVTEVSDDFWLLYVPFSMSGAQGTVPNNSKEFMFDSRAKRLVEEGTQLAVVVANAHATHGLEFQLSMRLLSMVRGTG